MSFVQIGVKQWIFANIKDVCSPTQSDFLTCPNSQVFFTASVIWSVLGGGLLTTLLTRRVWAQGFDRSKPSIWHWHNIPSAGVRFHHRYIPPFAILALATTLPQIMGMLGEHASDPPRHGLCPTRDGDQPLVVVPCRICVSVPHSKAQFCMVEQVQLCNECGDG